MQDSSYHSEQLTSLQKENVYNTVHDLSTTLRQSRSGNCIGNGLLVDIIRCIISFEEINSCSIWPEWGRMGGDNV